MKRQIFYCAAVIFMAAPSIALAQTATYKTTGGDSRVVGTDTVMGSIQDGTSTATYSDGSTRSETWTCIGTSEPPHSKIFDLHFVCDVMSSAGSYAINFGCNSLNADGLQGCVGGLTGKSGAYAGKMGATTWAGTNGTGMGTIQWLE